jgi:hypothetical protein
VRWHYAIFENGETRPLCRKEGLTAPCNDFVFENHVDCFFCKRKMVELKRRRLMKYIKALMIMMMVSAGCGQAQVDDVTSLLSTKSDQPKPNMLQLSFDDGVNDSTGRHAPTNSGAVITGSKATFNAATKDHITIPDSSDFDVGSRDFTIEVMVKTTMSGSGHIVSKAHVSCDTSMIAFKVAIINGYAAFSFQPDGQAARTVGSSVVINDGQWHHIAAVRKSTQFYLVVDGTKQFDVQTVSGSIAYYPSNAAIGRAGDCDASYFTGEVDEVGMYDYAAY